MAAATVRTLEGGFTVHELRTTDLIPPAVFRTSFYWIGKTRQSLSLVCADDLAFDSRKSSSGWLCLQILTDGDDTPMQLLTHLATLLQEAYVPCITLLSADGAYGLIPKAKLPHAQQTLAWANYTVEGL